MLQRINRVESVVVAAVVTDLVRTFLDLVESNISIARDFVGDTGTGAARCILSSETTFNYNRFGGFTSMYPFITVEWQTIKRSQTRRKRLGIRNRPIIFVRTNQN
jgi:hypothetical protein